MASVKNTAASLFHPWGKVAFINSLVRHPRILDVGCGNDAVVRIKRISPNCHYTGIDIADYNLSDVSKSMIDKYVTVDADRFAEGIESLGQQFDAVLSTHNFEHCDDRFATLRAMMGAVKDGGKIYMSFPCEESVDFPSREGTLNYFDDNTHKGVPPRYDDVITTMMDNGFKIDFSARRYQPFILRVVGATLEPLSKFRGRIMAGTWAFYGFEAVVIATRARSS